MRVANPFIPLPGNRLPCNLLPFTPILIDLGLHWRRRKSIYVFVLRLIFRQRRLTCSLAKVFKLYTSVRLKSVKNFLSPKPTTSLTTLRKSSHFSCISSFFATFPYFSTFFSKSQLLFAHLKKKV